MIFKSLWIEKNGENASDTACDICLGVDDLEGDEMVICDGCNVAVHQTCYGRDICYKIPDEN